MVGKHGSLSSEISSEVGNILRWDSRLLVEAKFKCKEKEDAIIWTTNIYLKDKSQLSEFVSYIADVVESILDKHLASNGEIIRLSVGGGTVSDRGEIWFEIVEGVVFEVYCFTCRSISFVRVLHEKQLYGEKNEWVSLDIDEYLDSQWFEE